jgi:hypothetical protein
MTNRKKRKQLREIQERYYEKKIKEGHKRILIWADHEIQENLARAKAVNKLSNPELMREMLKLYLIGNGIQP